ncbi:MAG: L,D-transpeptidase [Clostridium sp.]
MNKVKSVVIAFILMIICSTAAFADDNDRSRFVKGTEVNGISIDNMTVDEAKTQIGNTYAGNYKLTIKTKDGKTEVITGPEIGYSTIVPEGLQAILDAQNASGRSFGPHVDNSHEMQITGTYDEKALIARIKTLSCIVGNDIMITSDAHISAYQAGQPFSIIPEVQGNNVDVEKTIGVLRGAAAIGLKEINLAEWDCYYKVNIKANDESLKKLCDTMNHCKDMTITYTFGENTVNLPGETICTWLTGSSNGQIGVNHEQAAAYIASLAAQYDTAGTARTFHTAAGKDVSIAGPYGWRIDQAGETAALIAMIQTGQTQSREPQYASLGASRTVPDWGKTYVEIDLTGQHAYMYKDGVQVWEAPCVTGNVEKKYTTPPGIYSLTYKQTDRILKGDKKPDGTYEYESHVDYWMPFNGGIGLHDASWRNKFGGTIYQYAGSHGCVNLPSAKAKPLYDLVYTGIPVICYN